MRIDKITISSIVFGFLVSVFVSLLVNQNAAQNLRFHLRLDDRAAEKAAVAETISLFNQYYAKFFSTGGDLEGLGVFPADNMVKRRIVQELRSWILDGKVLVYDKDFFELESIDLVTPSFASAVSSETWFLNLQNRITRAKERGIKANAVKIRYTVKKEDGRWKVKDYEVFGRDDAVGPGDVQRFKQ